MINTKNYMNASTGVVWTEEEIRESYEQFKHEMEAPCDTFEDYLESLIQKGELEETEKETD